jgi:lipopolysaccharide biosynthesis protein
VVRIVPNCGRDIGPLITEFADDLVPYDVIGHFHTKKSTHVVGSSLVRDWVEFLMQNLLGTKYRSARNILAEFAADPQLGLVFADDPNSIGWDKNLPYGEELAERMGIRELPTQFFSFPVGTMFWARPAALKPLFDLRINWDEYPDEPLPIDGSMLHAAERLLPTISRHAGFGIKVTYAPGVAR